MAKKKTTSAATLAAPGGTAVLPATGVVTAPAPGAATDSAGPPRLAWRALLLDERAYATVRDDAKPFRRGFMALLVVIGIAVLAQLLALAIDSLTALRTEPLQKLLYDGVVALPWYTDQVKTVPGYAAQFQQQYILGWESLRGLLGLPSALGTGVNVTTLLLSTFGAWLGYGLVVHWLARWFGGQARVGQFLGVFGLAYAPLLLTVIGVVPGATVPVAVLFFAMLITKFIAVKQAHRLSTGYALAAILGAYLIWLLIFLAVALFGSGFGIEQAANNSEVTNFLRSLPFAKP